MCGRLVSMVRQVTGSGGERPSCVYDSVSHSVSPGQKASLLEFYLFLMHEFVQSAILGLTLVDS